MTLLIFLLYTMFILTIVLLAFFIVFHLKRYAIDHLAANIQIYVFVGVTTALVGINVLFFSMLPLEELVSGVELPRVTDSY